MFGFFRRKQSDAAAPSGSMWDEIDQDHEQLLADISKHLEQRMQRMKVDVNRRRFVTRDGKLTTISGLARRIHTENPHMPVTVIEECIADWLEQSYWPRGMSEAKMERQQVKIEAWIQAHWEASEPVG